MISASLDIPYLHDSNQHLLSPKVPLKFARVLQSSSKSTPAINVARFSFNASRSWSSKFMKHGECLLPQLRASNKMSSAEYVVYAFFRGRIGINYFFFSFS